MPVMAFLYCVGRPKAVAFRPCHSAPDIVVWMFGFDIIKIVGKKLPNVFHQLLLLYVQYIYGYIIITVFMGIQPLSNFFSAGRNFRLSFFVPNIFLSHIKVM